MATTTQVTGIRIVGKATDLYTNKQRGNMCFLSSAVRDFLRQHKQVMGAAGKRMFTPYVEMSFERGAAAATLRVFRENPSRMFNVDELMTELHLLGERPARGSVSNYVSIMFYQDRIERLDRGDYAWRI